MEYGVIQIMRTKFDNGESVTSYTPVYIDKYSVDMVSPFIAKNGKPYKNVTILETVSNKAYTIVGNYKDHRDKILKIERNIVKGFKR